MSDDPDGCEWVNVSSGTGLPGSPGQKAVKRLCVCVPEHILLGVTPTLFAVSARCMCVRMQCYFLNTMYIAVDCSKCCQCTVVSWLPECEIYTTTTAV